VYASYVVVIFVAIWLHKLIHEWIKKKAHKLEWWKNKIFKQGIGIAEKS